MFWSRLAIGLLVVVATTANAQSSSSSLASGADGKPWVLLLSGLTDEDSYEHALGSFHLGLGEATWLSLTAGQSRAPSTETDVRANLVAVGLEHDFGPIGIAVSSERWGDADNLESRDWQSELFFRRERFRVALLHERRAIDIYFSGAGAPMLTDLRRVGIDADGTGISGRWRISPLWQVYGSLMQYDYPRGVRAVPRAERLDLLSTSAVTLAYSFIDRYATLGFERAIGLKLLNIDFGRDRSTIDGETLRSLSASMLWPIAPRMDFEVTLGGSRAGGFGTSVYGGLTLLIYGGD